LASTNTNQRGSWNSKIGFIFAAAGSAVGLGNIWGFPSKVADNGGAIFLLIYIICCFIIGLPVMIAELTLGRKTGKNPVGAFRALGKGKFAPLIGFWGLLCGVMILTFYLVVAGWTAGYVFEEIFYFMGYPEWAKWFGALDNGPKNAIFSVLFMLATIGVITAGVSNGIEKATKLMMPLLFVILAIMIGYVLTLEGAMEGVSAYLKPDFSELTTKVVFDALGQSFFSLSLGMGALITYGSYLSKKQNIVESAAYVTITDLSVAFLAGFLIIPAMYVAQASGVQIFDENGNLFASATLVFVVLPEMFHNMGGFGLLAGLMFFILLGMAALTSTISLLEVPVSYAIDEHRMSRKNAAWLIGGIIMAFSIIVSFDIGLIDFLAIIFNNIGLPLGGLLICIFLGYFWKTENAILEIKNGYENIEDGPVASIWIFFIKIICPILIGLVFVTTVYNTIF
jgi:neurotransmitter:Na+ symporter, NSS family